MTIVPAHQLDMHDLQLLGNNTAEAIRLDHENLEAGNRDLYFQDEASAEAETESED